MWNDSRAIIHVDMDAYFASVEQQCNPLIKGKPVIITGRGGRTIVVTASYEAREYGIKTGMTLMEAKRLCPNVIRVEVDLEKYVYTTLRIRDLLLRFTSRIEVYSIDEFFLDVTHSRSLFGSPEEILAKVKDEIQQSTGLSCSCGLATNKLLAKIASDVNKPGGVTIVPPGKAVDFLNCLPVEKIHGIGKKTKDCLNCLGITRADELGGASISFLTSHFGFWGHVLKLMGEGVDNSHVPYYWEQSEVKSLGHSYTLPYNTSDTGIIRSYILMLCQRVATRLRNEGKSARTVALTVRYSDFKTFSRRKTAGYPIDTMYGIYRVCLMVLQDIGRLRKPVRLLGVSVSGLTDESRQLYLFDIAEKDRRFDRAIAEINSRYGEFTVKPASLLLLKRPSHQQRTIASNEANYRSSIFSISDIKDW